MPVAISKLAKKLGFTESEMKAQILSLGFEADDDIEDDVADLIIDELTGRNEKSASDIYEEMSEQEREREIVKTQRKKRAGKGDRSKRKSSELVGVNNISGVIEIPESISVKELAEKTGLSAAMLIGSLMKNGILANINQIIDFDTALIITDGQGFTLKKKRTEGSAKDIFLGNLEKLLSEDEKTDLKKRPPVVSIMGHVDHGKTTLLDAIRDANVVSTESGGITQHIGAYQVEKNGEKITFLDTPGHEAFTAMRARGARATDIAILVVAADDGVMPQTVEAINHAKEAGIPVIVAINKMDKPGANPDRVKAELAEHGLQPEDWSGDTIMVPVSALKKEGLDKLLETVLLVAEVLELKANPNRPAVGTVVESHLDPNLGPVATILINTGTMSVTDNIVVGKAFGRVKMLRDHTGKKLESIGPSDTAQLAGLSETVKSGQILQVVKDEKTARQRSVHIHDLFREEEMIKAGMGMQEILHRIKEGSLKLLKVILKADTNGSLEAIKQSLAKVKSDDVAIKVIHSGVGSITESDVMMAATSPGSLVIGFHTEANSQVRRMAERARVEVVTYNVIYEIIDDLTKLLSGMLEPEIVTTELGKFKVQKIFFTGKGEMVVGGKISDGVLRKGAHLRVLRDKVVIGIGELAGLKLVNEDVDELEKGQECGVRYKGKIKIEEHDVLEAWIQEKKMKTL
ncbi:translation initiation factor IF-2 [Patescibacteria group bacterium]|nr:translation initiation factor IF-2 [Patescibacteria group bacterium]